LPEPPDHDAGEEQTDTAASQTGNADDASTSEHA
jgi:hypothetical protein